MNDKTVPLTSQYSSLFGVTNVQTFMYFQTSSRDPLYLKCIVSSLPVNVGAVAHCGQTFLYVRLAFYGAVL